MSKRRVNQGNRTKTLVAAIDKKWFYAVQDVTGFDNEDEAWTTLFKHTWLSELAIMFKCTACTIRNRGAKYGVAEFTWGEHVKYARNKNPLKVGRKRGCRGPNIDSRSTPQPIEKKRLCPDCGKRLSIWNANPKCWACMGDNGLVRSDEPRLMVR